MGNILEHPTLRTLRLAAYNAAQHGMRGEAVEILQRAIEIARARYGEQSESYADFLDIVAETCRDLGYTTLAVELELQSDEVSRKAASG